MWLCLLPGIASAWNWADDDSRIAQKPQFAQSRAVCRRLKDLEPPAADRPDAKTRKALAGCDAAALYYGIGEPRQPERARQCALVQAAGAGDDAGDQPFAGISLLMMIYANGMGARRDLNLATALACRVHGAPAELDGRVLHLQKLAAEHWRGHDFDYCDDITSGFAGGLCAARDASIESAKRELRIERLATTMSPPARSAFSTLRHAEQTYARTSGDNEVDLSGTARAAFEIEQEQHLRQVFEHLLDRLEKERWPTDKAADYTAADKQLNAVYARIMAMHAAPDERGPYGSADSLPWTTVTHAGIRKTERAWLHYREAWVAFAAQRYPGLPADALRAVLTRQRIDELTPFLPKPKPKPARPAVTFHALPADAASVLAAAGGIVTGGDAGATPLFQVIFDPNAPSDAELWRHLHADHPDAVVRWLPVAYFNADSGPMAATMLAAADPAAALDANFRHYDRQTRHGALAPERGARLGAAQKRLLKAMSHWGGYTPMLIVTDADGTLSQTGGANAYIIDAAIARARGTPREIPHASN
ncbi:hypothetical protein SAHY_05873 [Salinisphaera hydrothermalis EPR70]